VQLHDYTGRHPDIRTAADGTARFTIPSNAFQSGQSYLCFAPAGINTPIPRPRHSTTQSFFGADDLDIPALRNGTSPIGRIYSDAGTPIELSLQIDATRPGGATIELQIAGPDNAVLGQQAVGTQRPPATLVVHPGKAGWCSVRATSVGLAEPLPFTATVTYVAPQRLVED
jgi:alpha-amylase